MPTIDLNADIGEGGLEDAELIALATSVNIACGGHAGSEAVMRRTIEASKAHDVAIGAHPGYEDPDNFGRVEMELTPDELKSLMTRQLERMLSYYPEMHHVKVHGALYNQANVDEAIAATVVLSILELKPDTMLYCPPDGAMARAALNAGLHICVEGFIDRAYMGCGNLIARGVANSIIGDFEVAAAQAKQICLTQSVETTDGNRISMPARTLCVHGDNPNASDLLLFTREYLGQAGVEFSRP